MFCDKLQGWYSWHFCFLHHFRDGESGLRLNDGTHVNLFWRKKMFLKVGQLTTNIFDMVVVKLVACVCVCFFIA